MKKVLFIAETALTLGMNLLVKRLRLNPRWKYLLLAVVVLNEVRGALVVLSVGKTALQHAM